jgi:hypothetical protein
MGVGWPTRLLASAQLGVPAAVVSVGLQSGILAPGQGAAIVGAAALSIGVAAVGAYRLGPTAACGVPEPVARTSGNAPNSPRGPSPIGFAAR